MHVIHPDGLNSFDMGVWQEDDGSAYLVRSVNNEYMGISQLSPDYTTTTGLVSTGPRVCRKILPLLASNSITKAGSAIWVHECCDRLKTMRWGQHLAAALAMPCTVVHQPEPLMASQQSTGSLEQCA